MKILDYAIYLDLFGENSKLLINQKTKMRSHLGLLVSFFTYIIFLLILVYELQEVIYKETPNIIVNKFDSLFYNSTTSFNENAFKLVLVQDNDDLAKYFTLRGFLIIVQRENNKIQMFKELTFSKCKAEELDDDFISRLKNQNLFYNKTTLCPKNLYSKDYEDLTNAYVIVRVELLECRPDISECVYNQSLYDEMTKGDISPFTYYYFFKSYMLNVFDSDKLLIPTMTNDKIIFGKDTMDIDHHFENNELITKENYIINHSKKENHYIHKNRETKNPKKPDSSSIMNFYFEGFSVKVTVRSYKGLLTAIANSFSLIRLALFIIKYFVQYHVNYLIDEVIIGRNFYSEKEETCVAYNTMNNTINDNKFLKQGFIDKKPAKLIEKMPSQKEKLTMRKIYLNITCWRYFFCRR
jgi:hypothetical protein